jgi:hypothetical protein
MMRAKAPLVAHLSEACASSCERERERERANASAGEVGEGGARAVAPPPPAEKTNDGAYEAAEKVAEENAAAAGGEMETDEGAHSSVAAQRSAGEVTAMATLAAASRQIAPLVDRFGRAMAGEFFLLFTVTFYANHAHNLTRSP